jgi:BirA family transcriptional regulator, biotin operon repressor / biotin---[acetyl-CoA-carboxylase] ligase
MDESEFLNTLVDLPLQGVRFLKRTGSTNDDALAWADAGARDPSLVFAEEQTRGRGRGSHVWLTPPGVGLAFSLVLRPRLNEVGSVPFFTALGALAVCEAVEKMGLHLQVKWPNDILLDRKKFCGILVDTTWLDGKVECIVLGVGVNVLPGSMPPPAGLRYPATCLESEAGRQIDRLLLLRKILEALLGWRERLCSEEFIQAWERSLAFRGETVEIRQEGAPNRIGRLEGLEKDGSLRLCSPSGQFFTVQYGEVHLVPVV